MSSDDSTAPRLPTTDELKSALTESPADSRGLERFLKRFQTTSVEKEVDYVRLREMYTHERGLEVHYDHKKYWSFFLMVTMSFMIGFQSLLLWKVGSGQWDYTKYAWLLPALLAQNLAQIVGLAVFVVRGLYGFGAPSGKSK